MLKLFHYKTPTVTHVKFQRIIMGWIAIMALLTEDIRFIWAFFAISLIGLFTGTEYNLFSSFYKIVKKLFSFDLITISKHHIHYYQINASVDFIDHFLRIIASGSALIFFYFQLNIAGWALIAFLSIFMMLSAYFGFCLSALVYIFLQSIAFAKDTTCNKEQSSNQNCLLAKHCFTPYKRCDSCHVGITQCLGTKYNIVVLSIGFAMSLFLFTDNNYLIEITILLIMTLIFWLGYQINYSTDELAQSNNTNILLNRQLKEYNIRLEDEVQKRTSEVNHLVIHDQLTDIYNRYWFENSIKKALAEVHEGTNAYAMAFLDLDKFKYVNDTGGHLAGDTLLCQIATLIEKQLSKHDSLARLGGDEFAIIFQTHELNKALRTCQEICKKVDAYRFDWEGHKFHIGVSIGLVALDKTIDNETELFRKSDNACYQAKKEGRNQTVIYKEFT